MPYRDDLDAAHLQILQLKDEVRILKKDKEWKPAQLPPYSPEIDWKNVMNKCKTIAVISIIVAGLILPSLFFVSCVVGCNHTDRIALQICKQKAPKGTRGHRVTGIFSERTCRLYKTSKDPTLDVPIWKADWFRIAAFEIDEYKPPAEKVKK